MSKNLVVIGSTGRQGTSLLDALHKEAKSSSIDITVYAVHRNPASAAILRNKYPSIKTVQGDINNAPAIFEAIGSTPDVVFSMAAGGKQEAEQGKGVISAAVRAGARHIVMSSVDRGAGGNVPSGVDNWDTKHEIERFLRRQRGGVTYTIIRPAAYLENFVPGFEAKVFATMWRDYLGDTPMKFVSIKDVGATAAKVMLAPENYRNAEINLSGDNLTFDEANRAFQKQTGGKQLPTASRFIVWTLMSFMKEFKQMTAFLKEKGYGAQVQHDLMNWEAYISQSDYVNGGKF